MILATATASLGEDDSKFIHTSKEVDWSRVSPIDFVNILKKNRHSIMVIDSPPPEIWIKKEHVPKLMNMIYSSEPAAPVMLQSSPHTPSDTSTVGNEAMFLIEGFKNKSYPPQPCSVGSFKPNPQDYSRWWVDQVLNSEFQGKVAVGGISTSDSNAVWRKAIVDSKSANVAAADLIFLSYDTISLGAAKIQVLVNRLTNVVEYVWSNAYRRYVRPQFVLPNAQGLYNRRFQ